jgi:hypothetical protein
MQGLECLPAIGFAIGLTRDIGMVSRIAEDNRAMRIAGTAVDTAVIDEEITRYIFGENGMFRIGWNTKKIY